MADLERYKSLSPAKVKRLVQFAQDATTALSIWTSAVGYTSLSAGCALVALMCGIALRRMS